MAGNAPREACDEADMRASGPTKLELVVYAPLRFSRIPRYTAVMAKVMVSMPDDLLSEVDAEASRLGTSRSAVLREFADSALRRRRTDRAAAMDRLLQQAAQHGGAAAERVKATRP
jgi:hypothetical protein